MRIINNNKIQTVFVCITMIAIILCFSKQVKASTEVVDGDYGYIVTNGQA